MKFLQISENRAAGGSLNTEASQPWAELDYGAFSELAVESVTIKLDFNFMTG